MKSLLYQSLVLITSALLTHANPVLDQSFVQIPNLGSEIVEVINDCCSALGQTFQAGLDGTLYAVSVDVQGFNSSTQVRVRIQGVSGGLPNGVTLGESLLSTSGSAISQLVVFPHPVSVSAGNQYAIVVDYPSGPPPGHALGAWLGNAPGGYGAGTAGVWTDKWTAEPDMDLHFKTFVQVPETATTAGLLILSLAGLFSLRRFVRAN